MDRKLFTIYLFLSLSLFFVAPQTTYAATKFCDDNSPASKPVLISAVAGKDSVTLTWTEAREPLTHYLVAYGRSETEIEYGNQNIGDRWATTYTVGGLKKGVKYYFKVRPVNGCRPGDFSNKLSAIPGVFNNSEATRAKDVNRVTSNLSIYKPVLGTNTSSTAPAKTEAIKPDFSIKEPSKCTTCVSWPLLITEAILLVFLLYFTERNVFLRPAFSVMIPIGIYILFWKINQGCSQSEFACKYFLVLEVIIFIIIVIVHKNKFKNI